MEVGGQEYDLSPDGWAAAADGFVEYCTEIDGRRIGYVDSPVYRYADAGGKLHDFGPTATDGTVVLRKDQSGGRRLLILDSTKTVSLALPEGARVEAYDEADQRMTPAETAREGGRVTLSAEGVDYFAIATR